MQNNFKVKTVFWALVLYVTLFFLRSTINSNQSLFHVNLLNVLNLTAILMWVLHVLDMKGLNRKINFGLILSMVGSAILLLLKIGIGKYLFVLSTVFMICFWAYRFLVDKENRAENSAFMLLPCSQALYLVNIIFHLNFFVWTFILNSVVVLYTLIYLGLKLSKK